MFGVKKGAPNIIFKAPLPKKASAIALGGQLGTALDKMFAASGSEIKAFTRKG